MSKGAVLDEKFIQTIGMTEQLLTLTAALENVHHPVFQEPLFAIKTKEVEETIWLERKYVFDNQISIKASYGAGEKVLVWQVMTLRADPRDAAKPVRMLTARELFLLGDWREFQRFKQFVKSMRILDAQARQWLHEHHGQFAQLAELPEGVDRILGCLAAISEVPDLDTHQQGSRGNTLELLAKTYSASLLPLRHSAHLASRLMRRTPDQRFTIFRLLSFVEDPQGGTGSLIRFLQHLAEAIGRPATVAVGKEVKNSRDLAKLFAAIRTDLLSPLLGGSAG